MNGKPPTRARSIPPSTAPATAIIRSRNPDTHKPAMAESSKVLRFGIPKGSLEQQTLELMRRSGWRVTVGSRSYMPGIDDPSLSCRLLRPQEMPRYIADGTLDAGITGSDWIVENGVDLVEVESFIYSKTSLQPTRWVLCVPERSPIQRLEDLEGKRVATEMVSSLGEYLQSDEFTSTSNFHGG